MRTYAITMKSGELRIESGLNFVNATSYLYPEFIIEKTIELERAGLVTDEDYPEIVTDEDYNLNMLH